MELYRCLKSQHSSTNNCQPVYLIELVHPYTPSRNTRRSTPKLKFLLAPTFDRRIHKSIKHFSNSFSHYALVLWNSFPFQIRNSPSFASFRKHLETHLFNSSFQLSLLFSWSHPQFWISDPECPSTLPTINHFCLTCALSSPLWGRYCACKAVD